MKTCTDKQSYGKLLHSFAATQSDPKEEAIHALLARFEQPPKYVKFGVVFSNPLIAISSKNSRILRDHSTGELTLICNPHPVELMSGKASLGTIDKPDVEEMKSIAIKSFFGKGRENVYDEDVRKGIELQYGYISKSKTRVHFVSCYKKIV